MGGSCGSIEDGDFVTVFGIGGVKILNFVAGVISMQKLAHAMKLGKLGEQIVLKSKKAFEQITYIGNESVDAEIYYMKKAEREREARREYRKGKKEKADINELFILDIMREGIKNGDARLF